MAPKRSWFLVPRAPIFEYSPSGPIALGSIIADPFKPDRPLVKGTPCSAPPGAHLDRITNSDWERVFTKSQKGRLGVFASFLQFIGLGDLDVGVKWGAEDKQKYRFDQLNTDTISSIDAWAEEQMRTPEVARHIGSSKWHKPVYIIVGLMSAKGATISYSQGGEWSVGAKVGVDLTAAGVPNSSVGPDAALSLARKDELSSKSGSDIVFAYRLNEIRYWTVTPEISDYESRGAAMSEDALEVEKDGSVAQACPMNVYVTDVNVSADDLEVDSVAIDDEYEDDGKCEVIFPA